MKNIKNNIVPKITLILVKDSKKLHRCPSLRRAQNFLRNKAEGFLKNGYSITIKVTYGYAINNLGKRVLFQNSGTYGDIESLKWAYQAFVREYLKVQK